MVTGAARRVGLSIATAFARAGCDLVLTYHNSVEDAKLAADALASGGIAVRLVRLNLADIESVSAIGSLLASELPRLDVLVHNASVYEPTPLESLTPQRANEAFRVNALAPLILTQNLAPRLAQSTLDGGGSVVAMGDIHAMGLPRKNHAAYAMSKAALIEMVRSLARELAPHVRVNAVAPGVVAWPDHGPESDELRQRAYLQRVPLARAGQPEDAAEAVRWLALEAKYVTGQIIRVDGGRSIG
ncbi:MAG: SDR family oxidoreductase [Phycisphaerales bacterium]|nr:SDR family oxidoreductase [Phycisphaerales bacterium]